MPNRQASQHRYMNCSITTDWFASNSMPEQSHMRFEASYSVCPDSINADPWQEFLSAVFDSGEHAAANALAQAKKSIFSKSR